MSIILQTNNLAKTYNPGTPAQVEALKPTTLGIRQGLFTAIIGRSGSGKSTLLHLLGALDRPSAGTIILGSQDVFSLNDRDLAIVRRQKVGFVFQAYNLLLEYTARENILLPLNLDGRDAPKDRFDQIIDLLGIRDRLDHYPNQLSGGEQQRVAIARALVTAPDILLADEPTGNLDSKTGDQVMRLLRDSAKALNQTLIIVTHDPGITAMADVLITLDSGNVVSIKDRTA
ncbi:MAG: ABC transporter ATP-binding protein [Clostridiales bacterium]|nr:ABC transporter ATP-binding protein [Clostridiales bacterium]